jgi:3-deoxy-manno-octulosonate cytidylyltransferase (CMP-KDO synthetase)
MNPIIIIPARMASTRLPGKPLADIAGLPMIVQVLNRATEANIGPVYVACSEIAVKQAVEKHGGKAVMTDPDLPSGTDRIHAALQEIDPNGSHDVVINVQGDEPTMNPELIRRVLTPFKNFTVDIATLATTIKHADDRNNPNVVKAVVAWEEGEDHGRALYFTRACAPANEGDLYHHIGLYAYKRKALDTFTALPPSPLEKREKLEQLRALENNMRVEVVRVNESPFGVDTPEDLEKARKILSST